ncbi:nicotinamide riboside transporter PnuC [Subdoligranulum variabile]|uniref:Nicotinamide mononucleotide transporter PnuC n=1 Tax=Subdoligranulum variabile DSM 15176 TaxID=411471 RepID=D1PP34_9FIRM|nr:nicotinamide mononucleotide transporter PnuC [Subdoligranulum variabile DSM 15176]
MYRRMRFFTEVIMSAKLKYFTKAEWTLWGVSVLMIVGTFLLFQQSDYLSLTASLIGVTALIFNAKGNPFGQVLGIAFCLLYGYISFTCSYYGEMITYLGMTAPMSLYALICWLRHPYGAGRAEVKVGSISRREGVFAVVLSIIVTVVFYFILRAFGTANLLPSTLSVTTSFLAVYLTARRSPAFAVAYAANDLVLILLWGLAVAEDPSYLSVVVCFVMFFANDIYGFINWSRMRQRQATAA